MIRKAVTILIMTAALLAVGPAAEAGTRENLERYMRRLINQERVERGRVRVRHHDKLHTFARRHTARQIAAENTFHSTARQKARLSRRTGLFVRENVGWRRARLPYTDLNGERFCDMYCMTKRQQVRELHEAFMASPGHRDAILDRGMRRVGIGIDWQFIDGWRVMRVTVVFGGR